VQPFFPSGARVEMLSSGHSGTLISRNNLAIAYGEAAGTAEAIPLLEQYSTTGNGSLGPPPRVTGYTAL
jgi:hypothetical protein